MAGFSDVPRRAWAEIDLGALADNLAVARRLAGGRFVIAVVKADAYGHGLSGIAAALDSGVEAFGVAQISEAANVREVAPESRIVLLGSALVKEYLPALELECEFSVSNIGELETLSRVASVSKKTARVHIVVDTGMGRMGCLENELEILIGAAKNLPSIQLTGISSHLPSADEDHEFTRNQLEAIHGLFSASGDAIPGHCLNSAGVMRYEDPPGSLVRAGLMLYGVAPEPEFQSLLKPVMTFKTRVVLVRNLPAGRSVSYGRTHVTSRPATVATLAAGYGDGILRHLSNKAEVLIGGVRCPLIGRVTMDQCMVDVSEAGPVEPGQEAVIIGSQGDEEISAWEIARHGGGWVDLSNR